MRYLHLPDNPHTWLVYHTTGFAVQGNYDFEYKELVYSTDDYEDALRKGRELYPRDPSGWTYDNFDLDLNTAAEGAKPIMEQHQREWDDTQQKIKEHPERYETYEIDGYTITMEKNAAFDTPSLPEFQLEGFRMVFLDDKEL